MRPRHTTLTTTKRPPPQANKGQHSTTLYNTPYQANNTTNHHTSKRYHNTNKLKPTKRPTPTKTVKGNIQPSHTTSSTSNLSTTRPRHRTQNLNQPTIARNTTKHKSTHTTLVFSHALQISRNRSRLNKIRHGKLSNKTRRINHHNRPTILIPRIKLQSPSTKLNRLRHNSNIKINKHNRPNNSLGTINSINRNTIRYNLTLIKHLNRNHHSRQINKHTNQVQHKRIRRSVRERTRVFTCTRVSNSLPNRQLTKHHQNRHSQRRRPIVVTRHTLTTQFSRLKTKPRQHHLNSINHAQPIRLQQRPTITKTTPVNFPTQLRPRIRHHSPNTIKNRVTKGGLHQHSTKQRIINHHERSHNGRRNRHGNKNISKTRIARVKYLPHNRGSRLHRTTPPRRTHSLTSTSPHASIRKREGHSSPRQCQGPSQRTTSHSTKSRQPPFYPIHHTNLHT